MSRRKTKRRKIRNPIDWSTYRPSTRGLVIAGITVAAGAALAITYLRGPKAEPIPQGPIPQPKPDHPPAILMPDKIGPKLTGAAGVRYGAKVSIPVPEGGESYDVVVRPLTVGETLDIRISTRVSTEQFTDLGEQCLGVTLEARVAMSPDGGIVMNQTAVDEPALCQETALWSLAPDVSIAFDARDLVVRIEAPALEDAYEMTVALTITEKAA